MSSIPRLALLLIATLLSVVSANPLPDPHTIDRRTPVSASAFSDWKTNFIFLGGSQSYGGYIPPDGTWYRLSDIDCLDLPAYAIGSCDSPTIDQIGVASGPCSFVGINGWSATMSGAAGEGYMTVGPPQRIVLAKCGS